MFGAEPSLEQRGPGPSEGLSRPAIAVGGILEERSTRVDCSKANAPPILRWLNTNDRSSGEAYLAAKAHSPQAQAWLPRADVDQEWSRRDRASPCARARSPVGLTRTSESESRGQFGIATTPFAPSPGARTRR